jgi:uncharacterized zinc-type alcohol dehydrogenase-like protein
MYHSQSLNHEIVSNKIDYLWRKIMIQAKALSTSSPTQPLTPMNFNRRDPKPEDVVIDIKFCGICHSDIHQARNEWGGSTFPMVPGHEIAGVVRSVGSKVTKFKVGDHVGVGCFVDSCRKCHHCESHLDQYCLNGSTQTYNSPNPDGTTPTTYGGYSNVIVVDENYCLRIPKSIPLDKAAPLLCAGITLFSPLKHWKAGPGKKVGIMGLGGLGHMGVKIASAMGAEVTVMGHSPKKRELALKMGAKDYVEVNNESFFKKAAQSFDLIINTISSSEINLNNFFNLLKLDATLVSVGVPDKPLSISPFPLILMRRNYAGSLIGSISETQEMLDFCAQHSISSDIEVIDPSQVNVAFERVLKGDVQFRFVIDMTKLS